jgi:hypothetical protein
LPTRRSPCIRLVRQSPASPDRRRHLTPQQGEVGGHARIREPTASFPSYAAKAGVCVRTVATELQRLRELGWVRRCAERWADGRFVLEQETQRVWPAAGEPVARLPAASGGSRAGMGAGAHHGPLRSPRLPWRGSGGQGASTGQRPQGRPGSRPGTARAGVPGTKRLIFPECSRCGETSPRVKSCCNSRPGPVSGRKTLMNKGRLGGRCQ